MDVHHIHLEVHKYLVYLGSRRHGPALRTRGPGRIYLSSSIASDLCNGQLGRSGAGGVTSTHYLADGLAGRATMYIAEYMRGFFV